MKDQTLSVSSLPSASLILTFVLVCTLLFASAKGQEQTPPAAPSNQEKAEQLVRQTFRQYDASYNDENVRLLEQASKLDPKNPRVWWRLSEAYQLTGQFDLAVKAAKQNLKLHPDDYNNLGLAYAAKKDYAEAANAYEKAARSNPIPAIQFNLVDAYCKIGQFKKALPAAQKLVEMDSSDPSALSSALMTLGGIYARLHQPEKEEEILAKLRPLHPEWNSMDCEFTLSDDGTSGMSCKWKVKKAEAAGQHSQDTLKALMLPGQVWNFVKSRQYNKALTAQRELVALSACRSIADQADDLKMLGAIYLKLGQIDNAQIAFEQAHVLNSHIRSCEIKNGLNEPILFCTE